MEIVKTNQTVAIPLPKENFVTVSEDHYVTVFRMANYLQTIVELYQDRKKSFLVDAVIQNVIDDGLVEEWKKGFAE